MAKTADFFDNQEDEEVLDPGLDIDLDEEGDSGEEPAGKTQKKESKEESTEDKPEGEEDVEIEVVENPLYAKPKWKEDPANKIKSDEEDYGKKVKKRIGDLQAAATELQRQRDQKSLENEELVKAYRALQTKNTDLQKKISTGTMATLERTQQAEERAASLAKKNLSEALAAGDVEKVTKAQEELAQATVNVSRVKERITEKKEAESVEVEQEQDQTRKQAPIPPAIPKARIDWFRANPWFNPGGGDELSEHALAVHRLLVERGVEADSAKYFETINRSVKTKFADRFGSPKPSAPVPPSSRVAPNQKTSAIQGNKVRLTSQQVEAAKSLGLTTPAQLKRYALEILALETKE